MLDTGETRARLVFVANRPERMLNLPLDPIDWSFRLGDFLSVGLASSLFEPLRSFLGRLPLRIGGFDPLTTYVTLANLLTGGLAAPQWCISREQLERDFLVQHFMQHYRMMAGSRQTWGQIPDWLDSAGLPRWVVTGVSP